MWMAKYKWSFVILTFIFLGAAFYQTFKDGKKDGKWSLRILYGTTALSLGLVIYTILFR